MKIDNATLRRIIKEEMNNVMMEINGTTPDPEEVDRFIRTQQESPAAMAMFLGSMYGQVADSDPNIQSANDIEGITISFDGDGDVNVSNKALQITHDFLQKKAAGDSEDAQLASDGLEALQELIQEPLQTIGSFGTADNDGNGYLNSEVSGGFSLGSNSEGGIYTTELLKLVVDKIGQQAASTPEASAPSADISPDKIEKTQSPNGKAQLVVSAVGKLTQDQIQKIASENGITSYTVNNNTSSGPVFITAN